MSTIGAEYSVTIGTIEDLEDAYRLLAPLLVDKTKPEAGQARDTRRLLNVIIASAKEQLLVILRYGTDVVGVQVLQDRKNRLPLIIHSNIDSRHKHSRGTVLLLNMTVNCIFKDRDVYVLDATNEVKTMVEPVAQGIWKVKQAVSKAAIRYLGRHHG